MTLKRVLAVVAALCLLALAACDGGGSSEGGEGGGAQVASSATPQELGVAVLDIYMEGLTAIAAMADNPPPLEEAKEQLTALKESMITRLVEIGKIRATMSAADQRSVDSALSGGFMRIDQTMFTKYNQVLAHYRSQDMDFANMIASMNIITQYADFELLKQQEPAEAARLGIQ